MSLLDGGLAAVFGAAFGAVLADGTLHKMQQVGSGTGGFAVTATDYPAKLCLDSVEANERAASGIPNSAVKLTVLRAGLPVTVDLDDELTLGGATYRAIKVDTDPAGAAFAVVAVPA